jgi:1,4-dihydroxy-2-naphthoate octaprenyltransferase
MIGVWMQALRPKTLVASIAPVVLATALVGIDHEIHWSTFTLTLLCAMLIQIASNFINEIEDARRGADTAARLGPQRAVASGLISARTMRFASVFVILAAFFLGLPLVARAGWEVLAIGVLCLTMSWMYTGGPFPLAYKGLGDLFAFLFFGVIAVVGAVYVQTMHWDAEALLLSCMPGLFAANILGVNNIRDIETDAVAGKRTMAVRLGATPARIIYTVFTVVAVVVVPLAFAVLRSVWFLIPLSAIPVGIWVVRSVWQSNGAALNRSLALTALLYMICMILTVIACAITVQ